MGEVVLTEYETTPAVHLTATQRDALRDLAPSISLTPTVGSDNSYDLTPSSHVGVVQVQDLSIRIQPKLAVDRLMFLVGYSLGGMRLKDLYDFSPAAGIFESIIPGFATQIRAAFKRGLLQGYVTKEEALPGVRGRIRFDDQLRRRYGIASPIEVRFDDYTEDIEVNRLIKAAIRRLGRMRIRSRAVRRELRLFDGVLARVSDIEYSASQTPQPSFNRLNQHYEPAARLAQLILRSTSFEVSEGDVTASAFLIDMNRVFEDFVVAALRDELGLSESSFPQGGTGKSLKLDRARRIPLKPDVSWWNGKRCIFVGDVKYKRTRNQSVPNADLYQLLAYTVATGLPGGLLIYAAGEDEPVAHEVVGVGKRLEVVALDLRGSPDDVLGQMRTLARQVRRMASRAVDRLAA